MDKIIKILSEIESSSFVHRIFMNSDDVRICNKLVKEGLLRKGKTSERNATIAFYITDEGSDFLEKNSK